MKVTTPILLAALLFAGCEEDPVTPAEPLLDYYIESFQVPGLEFEPKYKVVYEYDDSNRILRYRFFGYNPDTDKFEEQRRFNFSYDGERVEKIEGVLTDGTASYVSYTYTYNSDGTVNSINEVNTSAGTTSLASFAYGSGNTVKVVYAYSNGTGFEYEYTHTDGNILSDKTTKGSQVCSSGVYTYDQGQNPFRNLGYVDYLLTNISANNKLTESVDYVGCGFPSLVPESYSYTYNEDGYPVKATTHYKSSGGNSPKSEKTFFYR